MLRKLQFLFFTRDKRSNGIEINHFKIVKIPVKRKCERSEQYDASGVTFKLYGLRL